MDRELTAKLHELRPNSNHLVARHSVPLREPPKGPLRQIAPSLLVYQLSALPARPPCASCPSKEYRKTIVKEIRTGIDREHWRRLAEVAVVTAEIGTRNEGHTTGVMRQASCRRSR